MGLSGSPLFFVSLTGMGPYVSITCTALQAFLVRTCLCGLELGSDLSRSFLPLKRLSHMVRFCMSMGQEGPTKGQ